VNPPMSNAASNKIPPAQTGSGTVQDPGSGPDWHTVRQGAGTNDGLRDRTFKWLATLPAAVRPMATGREYPRILNRMGDLWGHCEYTRLYFQSLLIDRRKGRRGFPAAVRKELEALQRYYFEHLSGLPAIIWNAVPLHPQRIPHKVFPRAADTSEIEILPP